MEIKFEKKEVERILEKYVFKLFAIDPTDMDISSTESYGDFKISVYPKEIKEAENV